MKNAGKYYGKVLSTRAEKIFLNDSFRIERITCATSYPAVLGAETSTSEI